MSKIWDKPNLLKLSDFNGSLLSSYHVKYDNLWIHQVTNFQPKLRKYCLFKKHFETENYLSMFTKPFTTNFSRLRVRPKKMFVCPQPTDRLLRSDPTTFFFTKSFFFKFYSKNHKILIKFTSLNHFYRIRSLASFGGIPSDRALT